MLQQLFAGLAVALVLAGTANGAQTLGGLTATPSRYGQHMLRSYELPAALLDRYNDGIQVNAASAGAGDLEALGALETWSGSAFSAGSSNGPHTVVVKVFGSAVAPGDLGARWQLSWSGQPGALPGMDVPDAHPGILLQIAVASEPMDFKVDREVVPSLKLVSAKNLRIERVRIEVWSGMGEESWLDWLLEWWLPLTGGVMWTALLLFLRFERKRAAEVAEQVENQSF